MLQALLKGKLSREQENMEDILTSNVFGLLKYVAPEEGLLNYLALAEDKGGNQQLKYLRSLNDGSKVSVEYEFWPWWEEFNCVGCEPDVVLELKLPDKQDLLILIEAKYLSGKSSKADEAYDAPTDQLAKEWDNLVVRAGSSKSPVLIYLTAHYGYPLDEIEDTVREFRRKRPDSARPVIYWLSWRHLYKVCECSYTPVLADIRCLLERFNFKFFDGVILEYNNILWSFEEVINWQTSAGPQSIKWGFNILLIKFFLFGHKIDFGKCPTPLSAIYPLNNFIFNGLHKYSPIIFLGKLLFFSKKISADIYPQIANSNPVTEFSNFAALPPMKAG